MTEHLSPKRLAGAVGVSESSIKRWVDAGKIDSTVTAGGHRRIPLASAIRFIRESGIGLADPAALGLNGDPDADRTGRLYGLVLRGRAEEAVSMIQSLFISGMDAARIIDEPFRETMERLGMLWHDRGEEGIYLEHRATQIGLRLLQELRALQSPLPASAPLALGGAPAGDPYLLPSLAVAIVLESVGFSTANLGPETPQSAFVSAIENLRPSLVWISLTSESSQAERERFIRTVSDATESVGARLVLGGQAGGSPGHAVDAFRGSSMLELAAFARGVLSNGNSGEKTP